MALHRRLPGVVEADDVGVLQALQHLHLLAETLPLRLGQLPGLQRRGDNHVMTLLTNSVLSDIDLCIFKLYILAIVVFSAYIFITNIHLWNRKSTHVCYSVYKTLKRCLVFEEMKASVNTALN